MNIQEAIHTLESHGATIYKGTSHYMVRIYDYTLDVEQELTLTENEVISLYEEYFNE